ncbi:hypothetical protein Hdeb2414_s0109g00797471 [Helianthus debilis subsp. tardiflorus]
MLECTIFYFNGDKAIPKKFESNHIMDNLWYLENVASNHMTENKLFISELNKQVNGKVHFGDDSCVEIVEKARFCSQAKLANIKY